MVSKELVHTLIEQTPVAYIIMDDRFRIHYVNESFLKLRNLDKDTTIGEKCYNISNGGKQCLYCSIANALRTGKKAFIQRKDILPNGCVRYIDDYAIPLFRDADTGRTYLLEIMVNRSEELIARQQYKKDMEEMVSTLVELLEAKDRYTALHSKNVHKYSNHIAKHLGLTEEDIFHVSLAASLHDIGKVGIPLNILNKPGKLSDEEYHVIQSHPKVASDMLKDLVCLQDISEMVRHHHERIDGHGYPDGISGDKLSLGSKILAVADTYDAMTADRPYRKALSRQTAFAELNRVAGTQLDETIVQIFEEIPETEYAAGEQAEDNAEESRQPILVRQLPLESVSDVRLDLVVELKDLENQVDTDRMRSAIFEQTPCGYVVLDKNDTLVYANSFFLALIGMTAKDAFGKEFNLFTQQPEDEVGTSYIRMMRNTGAGIRTFDVYPMASQDETYKLYTIIDRTKEAEMTRQMDKELKHLLELLEHLWEDENNADSSEYCSPEEIRQVKERMEALLNRRKLRKSKGVGQKNGSSSI